MSKDSVYQIEEAKIGVKKTQVQVGSKDGKLEKPTRGFVTKV